MYELTKGGNAPLTGPGKVRIIVSWVTAPCDLDAVCFAVGHDGHVPADEWFLFYGHQRSPAGAITFNSVTANRAEFQLDLDALPLHVERCVFAGVLQGAGRFEQVQGISASAVTVSGTQVIYRVEERFAGKALIFVEVYRHVKGWKMRAIGSGFKDGLKPLAESYGVRVEDQRPAPDKTEVRSNVTAPRNPVPPPPAARPTPPNPGPAPGGSRPTPPPAAPPPPGPDTLSRKVRPPWLWVGLAVAVALLFGAAWVMHRSEGTPSTSEEMAPPADGGETMHMPPTPQGDATGCKTTNQEVFERYHQLGESYKEIVGIVNNSDNERGRLRSILQQGNVICDAQFTEASEREINHLRKLPLDGWINETTQLSTCAGRMNSEIENRIKLETRNTVLSRLIEEADRSRSLESDLTNIARDLAYYKNKAARLIEAYQANLAACKVQ